MLKHNVGNKEKLVSQEKSKPWLTTIEINHIPNMKGKDHESWLFNPFNDNTIYGVKFHIDDEVFSWSFFLDNSIKGDALRNGYRLLAHLKEKYPGIDCDVQIKKKNSEKIKQDIDFYELRLPILTIDDNINILSKIVSHFKINPGHKIKFLMLWKRDEGDFKKGLKEIGVDNVISVSEAFRIRIFVSIDYKYDPKHDLLSQESEIKGYLDALEDIQNIYGKRAELVPVSPNIYHHILYGGHIKNDLLTEKSSTAHPSAFDFLLPESLPIIKPKDEIYGGLEFKKEKNKVKIILGDLILDAVKTKRKAHLYLNDLVFHIFISGLTGAGKTHLFSQLSSEIRQKASDVGILIINLEKENEHLIYDIDLMYRFDDLDFKMPYYIKGKNLYETLDDVANYLIAAVGMDNIVATNMGNVLEREVRNHGDPPKYVDTLFEKLKTWFKESNYEKDYRNSIVTAINNRVLKLFSDPIIRRILELPPIIPDWFKAWINGKTVFIDLAGCKMPVKRLLTLAIFQMINVYMPKANNKLKNVIFIDEIGAILTNPVGKSDKNDDAITSYYINELFSHFLNVIRSRGTSLVYAGQRPATLFPNVSLSPNIKILFRTEQTSGGLFINRLDVQDDFFFQKNRIATVIDGVNARQFSFYSAPVNRGEET